MNISEIEQKSYDFIDHHLQATFDEVPEELLKLWHVIEPFNEYLKEDYSQKYEFKIYLYALKKYEESTGIHIPEDKVVPIFKVFQLLLVVPSLKKTRFPSESAFKIFDFKLYSELL